MKKLLFAVSAIAALSLLLVPGWSIAQYLYSNQVGLYLESDGTGPTGTIGIDIGSYSALVYLVLTKPTQPDTGIPFNSIEAFECRMNFNPVGNLFKSAESYYDEASNWADSTHIEDGWLEYYVRFTNGLPVINEHVVLVSILFTHYGPGSIEVTLTPLSDYQPSNPGQMSFTPWGIGHQEGMYPSSGSRDAPVFLFGGEAVAVENGSFGLVKALYR